MSPSLVLVFVLGLAAGASIPSLDEWMSRSGAAMRPLTESVQPVSPPRLDQVWSRAGNPVVRHPVEVLRTIDGDTFEARVYLWPGLEVTTRVRLRGIDAPELRASCPAELEMAQAAGAALHALLDQGGVTIGDIGPDKYNGRVVASASTRLTPDVSAAMLTAGHARRYSGGHRSGWCANASR